MRGTQHFTLLVKTLLRPDSLERLVRSVRGYYPQAPIIVADDGWHLDPELRPSQWVLDQVQDHGGRYLQFAADAGVGLCLNTGARAVTTPWVVVMEDDFELTDQTHIERLLAPLQRGEADLAGGAVWNTRRRRLQDYVGHLEVTGRRYALRRIQVGQLQAQAVPVDVCLNFYACDPRLVQLNEDQKVHRHMDWFLRLRQWPNPPPLQAVPSEQRRRVVYVPGCTINHHAESSQATGRYRQLRWERQAGFRQLFLETWGLDDVPDVEG